MKEPVAMIKESLAKKEFGTAQNAVGTSISSNETTYRIIGVYGGGSKYDQYGTLSTKGTDVVVPYKLYYDGQNANEGDVIKLTFPQDAPASKVSKKIAKYLEKNGSAMNKGTYAYYDMEKELKAFSSQINMITGFISLIAAISLPAIRSIDFSGFFSKLILTDLSSSPIIILELINESCSIFTSLNSEPNSVLILAISSSVKPCTVDPISTEEYPISVVCCPCLELPNLSYIVFLTPSPMPRIVITAAIPIIIPIIVKKLLFRLVFKD